MISNSNKTESTARGATDQKVRLVDRWRSYKAHHRMTFLTTLQKMLGEPLQTILTVVVIAIALALPSVMFLALHNLQQLSSGFESSAQITVFVKKDINSPQIKQLGKELNDLSEVVSTAFISADQALEEFKALSGFGSALQYLDDNPLPAVFLVQPEMSGATDLLQTQELVKAISQLTAVEDIQIDMLWIQRLATITEVSKKLVLAMSIALSIGVLLVIGNTIRLAIQNRREEIIVVKLVGGTDAYVRRPFLYTGLLLGLFGGILASILLLGSFLWIGQSVAVLANLYQSQFQLMGPGLTGISALCSLGALIGLMGAWVAVMQNLRAIEPK
jgi:cell division transport system permease protein